MKDVTAGRRLCRARLPEPCQAPPPFQPLPRARVHLARRPSLQSTPSSGRPLASQAASSPGMRRLGPGGRKR